ncbi:EamA domain-containing membrane protein RarD [Chitinophaga skermanii]|uniref:EamA domain-containing membrane protein RarD n=1 Tax=Chitinophaga skermanii TaxID=331697 RepID=A0A327R4E1_9BACT|nr:DMT family transporter [Chitinophaga skermanii]RAJ10634.1 EamA domain-containing membrane protein RarD [Chitinophaga skermanii]
MSDSSIPRSRFILGFSMALFGAICFSAKAIFAKLAYRHEPIDAISVLALRMIFSIPFYLVTAIWLYSRPGNQRLTAKQWGYILVLGFMGYYLSSILDFMGLQYISAGLERLILFLYPTFSLLMAAVFFKKKITKLQWSALGLAYIGMLIAFYGDIQTQAISRELIIGSLLVLGCAITYAFYIVGGGEVIPQVGSMKFTAYALTFSSIGVFAHYMLKHGIHFPQATTHVYWLCAMMAIISTVIPTFLMSEGIRMIGAGNTAIITSVGPVATIAMAYFFLGEEVNVPQVFGTILVLAGVVLIGKKGKA